MPSRSPVPIDPGTLQAGTASRHILVADDDERARHQLVSILEDGGYEVEAVNARGARPSSAWLAGGIDVALIDVVMPEINGLDTCRLIKAAGVDVFIPVILLALRTDSASRVERPQRRRRRIRVQALRAGRGHAAHRRPCCA